MTFKPWLLEYNQTDIILNFYLEIQVRTENENHFKKKQEFESLQPDSRKQSEFLCFSWFAVSLLPRNILRL